MILPRASSLDLASRCLYPWTSGHAWSSGPERADATRGTAVHAVAASVARGDVVDLDALPPDVRECVERVLDVLERDHASGARAVAVEAGVAYDHASGRARLTDPAETEPRPGEYRGHVDLVLRSGDTLIVRDWKTGQRARSGRAADSAQLLFYALCALQIWPAAVLVVELAHVGASSWVDRATIDPVDLGAHRALLAGLAARVERAQEVPRVGSHCASRYCPIASSCPAGRALAERVAEAVALPIAHEMTDALAVEILARIPLADAYLSALRDVAEERVRAAGVVVAASGERWGVVERVGAERLTLTPEAEAILAPIEGAVEIERSVSRASIERALRPSGRGWTSRARAVVEQLREAGAVRRGAPWSRVEVISE